MKAQVANCENFRQSLESTNLIIVCMSPTAVYTAATLLKAAGNRSDLKVGFYDLEYKEHRSNFHKSQEIIDFLKYGPEKRVFLYGFDDIQEAEFNDLLKILHSFRCQVVARFFKHSEVGDQDPSMSRICIALDPASFSSTVDILEKMLWDRFNDNAVLLKYSKLGERSLEFVLATAAGGQFRYLMLDRVYALAGMKREIPEKLRRLYGLAYAASGREPQQLFHNACHKEHKATIGLFRVEQAQPFANEVDIKTICSHLLAEGHLDGLIVSGVSEDASAWNDPTITSMLQKGLLKQGSKQIVFVTWANGKLASFYQDLLLGNLMVSCRQPPNTLVCCTSKPTENADTMIAELFAQIAPSLAVKLERC